VGRKSNKEIRDEAIAKEMALGTQQPMDSFLGKQTGSHEKLSKEEREDHINTTINNDSGLLELSRPWHLL